VREHFFLVVNPGMGQRVRKRWPAGTTNVACVSVETVSRVWEMLYAVFERGWREMETVASKQRSTPNLYLRRLPQHCLDSPVACLKVLLLLPRPKSKNLAVIAAIGDDCANPMWECTPVVLR